MSFIHDDFLLETKTAQRLFHTYAAQQPIIDYHCHLPPKDVAEDRRFANLFEIWLEGDHYKWRAMRASGVPERFCTGDADAAREVSGVGEDGAADCLRNPLYHWTHLELKRYFGIDELLDEKTADSVWERANEQLKSPQLSAKGILGKFCVKAVCTTDDPADPLTHHETIAASGLPTKVYPTFRADRVMDPHQPDVFNPWVDKLAKTANVHIAQLHGSARRAAQAPSGVSRHRRPAVGPRPRSVLRGRLHRRSRRRRSSTRRAPGTAATPDEREAFASYMMVFFGHLDAEKGWTKQLHLGARRNANTRALKTLGRDTGYDSIGDLPQVDALGRYLDRLEQENALPKTIIYNLNPRRQLRVRDDDREFSGRQRRRQDPVRQRLVVPRSEGSDGVAAQRALEQRPARRTSSACSPTRARSCRTRGTNTSAACSAICSGAKWRPASCRTTRR